VFPRGSIGLEIIIPSLAAVILAIPLGIVLSGASSSWRLTVVVGVVVGPSIIGPSIIGPSTTIGGPSITIAVVIASDVISTLIVIVTSHSRVGSHSSLWIGSTRIGISINATTTTWL
jgi:hypothetical protein